MTKYNTEHVPFDARDRWWALAVVSLGSLMIVLDATIVVVALPLIKAELHFSETSLVWVVNAYLLPYAGFLLLGGRLGDLFGHRRIFLLGIAVFSIASLGCGVAQWQGLLISSRALQGLGGAFVSAVSLSLALNLFSEPRDRATAMSVFGFVSVGGGSIALLLGGTLTSALNWHWIFLINVPVGTAVCAFGLALLSKDSAAVRSGRLDIPGALTITTSLMIALYALVEGSGVRWTSAHTLHLFAISIALLIVFLGIEHRASAPLIPLRLFRQRNRAVANIVGVLSAAGSSATYLMATLYLQLVLQYNPLQVGLAFLPPNLIAAASTLGLSGRLVICFGIKLPWGVGLLLTTLGLLLLSAAPVDGKYAVDVLPAMLLLGLGGGIASTPLLLAATTDVSPSESGLASGLIATTTMMGFSLGLAAFASVAAARTTGLLRRGVDLPVALNGGYHVAFLIGAGLTLSAVAISATCLRHRQGNVIPTHPKAI